MNYKFVFNNEISLTDLGDGIKRKVFELEEKQREMSLENIAHIIMSGQIKVYLNQDEEYQIMRNTIINEYILMYLTKV